MRGKHVAVFAANTAAADLADSFNAAVYAPDQENCQFFGLAMGDFIKLSNANDFWWAPKGNEAFDDGSRVLQFDVGNRVRLIGFKTPDDEGTEEAYIHDLGTLTDLWIDGDLFYGILSDWCDAIIAEWSKRPKSPDDYWRCELA